jgi:hypothetical protein
MCANWAVLVAKYSSHMGTAMMAAFSTASSRTALPITMEGVKFAGVDEKARRFVLPMSAMINMDGTVLIERFIRSPEGRWLFAAKLLTLRAVLLKQVRSSSSLSKAGTRNQTFAVDNQTIKRSEFGTLTQRRTNHMVVLNMQADRMSRRHRGKG